MQTLHTAVILVKDRYQLEAARWVSCSELVYLNTANKTIISFISLNEAYLACVSFLEVWERVALMGWFMSSHAFHTSSDGLFCKYFFKGHTFSYSICLCLWSMTPLEEIWDGFKNIRGSLPGKDDKSYSAKIICPFILAQIDLCKASYFPSKFGF